MILRIAFAEAAVYYEDNATEGYVPTPEHVEDTLIRMERVLHRIWAGHTPDALDLPDGVEVDQSRGD